MSTSTTNPLRVGLRQERVITPQCLIIFGASGDLTHRKLVPALFELFKQRRLPSEFAVLGCARRPWSDEEFRQKMEASLKTEINQNPLAWEQFSGCLFYEPVDLQQPSAVVKLGKRLDEIDRLQTQTNIVDPIVREPRSEAFDLKEKAMESILKLVSMSDLAGLSKDETI